MNESRKTLEEQVQLLQHEVHDLKQRLTKLESTKIKNPISKEIMPTSYEVLQPNKSAFQNEDVEVATKEIKTPQPFNLDQFIQTWLPRLFIFVFIVGVIWGFKAASDYGFMRPSVKVALGFVVSTVLLVVGYFQMKKDRMKLGHVLLGGAVPLLMITTFAMHVLYNMCGPTTAFILNLVWIMIGLFLTIYYKSQVLGFISMIGGILVPFLIESKVPNPYVFLGYETALYLLFLLVAVRYRFWPIYYSTAVFFNIALGAFYLFTDPAYSVKKMIPIPVLIQYALILIQLIRDKKHPYHHGYTLLTSLMVTYAWIYSMWSDRSITLFLIIGFVVLAGLCFVIKEQRRVLILLQLTFFSLFFIGHVVGEDYYEVAFLLDGLAVYYIGAKTKSLLQKFIGITSYSLAALVIVFMRNIQDPFSFETFQWLLVIASFVAITYVGSRYEKTDKGSFLTFVSFILTALLLAFSTEFTLAAVKHLEPQQQRLILTFVWMFLAVLAIVVGLTKRFSIAKYAGVGMLILTLLKLVFYDLPFIPIPLRAVLFIALGIVGLGVSRAFYKRKE